MNTRNRKLLIKSEVNGNELFKLLHDLVMNRYAHKKHIKEFRSDGRHETITRIELAPTKEFPEKLSDLSIIVEIFEKKQRDIGGLRSTPEEEE